MQNWFRLYPFLERCAVKRIVPGMSSNAERSVTLFLSPRLGGSSQRLCDCGWRRGLVQFRGPDRLQRAPHRASRVVFGLTPRRRATPQATCCRSSLAPRVGAGELFESGWILQVLGPRQRPSGAEVRIGGVASGGRSVRHGPRSPGISSRARSTVSIVLSFERHRSTSTERKGKWRPGESRVGTLSRDGPSMASLGPAGLLCPL